MTSIGRQAFYNCTSLASVTIYAPSLTTYGIDAFQYNASDRKIYVYYDCLTNYKGATNWSNYANAILPIIDGTCGTNVNYSYDSNRKTLCIFGTGAMYNYNNWTPAPWHSSNFTNVIIGNGVTSIGNYAFSFTGLTSIEIPASVTSIGDWAFDSCTGLTSIIIPSSVTSIGNWAFNGCTALESIMVTDGNTVYDSRNDCNAIIRKADNALIFGCKNTVIPSSVTSIGNRAFYRCTGLTSITIPNGVTSIGGSAFEDCTGLTSITIPASVTSIGSEAFDDCSALTSVTIYAPSLTTYGYGNDAFAGNASGRKIYVPAGSVATYRAKASTMGANENDIVGYDGTCGTNVYYAYDSSTQTLNIFGTGAMTDYSFTNNAPWNSYRENITTVVIGSGVTSIGEYAFYDCTALTSITIPSSVTSIGYYAFSKCENLATMTVAAENTKYDSRGDCNAIIETNTNKLVVGCKNSTIPEGVTSIGNYAFYSCTGLASITIPNGVTSIGVSAFEDCTGLTSIEIPASVTSIGNHAFYYCTSLASVTIYAPSLTTTYGYGNDAFNHNANGRKIYVYSNCLTNYTINATRMGASMNDIELITLTANEGAEGEYWTTYYNELANAKVPSSAQAFKVTLSGTTLELKEITDGIISRGEAVVIKSISASIRPNCPATASTDTNDNNLQGTMKTITNPGNAYVLNKTNENGVGFYKLTSDGTIGAHKAYLTSSAGARQFFLFDEATGIVELKNSRIEELKSDDAWYTLDGRKLDGRLQGKKPTTKGLYIVNGKKVVIK